MRRAVSILLLALICVSLSACESFPHIEFTVWDAKGATVAELERPASAEPDAGTARRPVANAIILAPTDGYTGDPAALAATLRDDPHVTQHMHRPPHPDGGGAFAARTGPEGDATYSEIHFQFWFIPSGAVERRFFVWAEGFEPRTVTVQFGTTGCRVDVPLERVR